MQSLIFRVRLHTILFRTILSVLIAAVPGVAVCDIYTGVDAYGIPWFSDQTPAQPVVYRTYLTTPSAPDVDAVQDAGTEKITDKPASAVKASKKKQKHRATSVSRGQSKGAKHRKSKLTSQQKRCLQYDRALRKIRAQLRAGYHEPQGRKLHNRRRELEAKQFEDCS